MKQFGGSLLVAAVGLALAGWYGFGDGGWAGALDAAWIVAVLAVLEVSLSFDNAVVNASILGRMSAVWQRRFLTWGMLFAVFGTRVVFPLAIVGSTAGLGPVAAVRMSLADPARYEAILTGAHPAIAGFGGAFLVMVGVQFFLGRQGEAHWLGWPERALAAMGRVPGLGWLIAVAALAAVAWGCPAEALRGFLGGGLAGLVGFGAVHAVGHWLEGHAPQGAGGGFGLFVYLNLLDASFSLDGVIGAFALSNNMIVIAIGLTIGAVFVRSLTMALVRRGTLGNWAYLEHGAFWAILALGLVMLVSVLVPVPEAVTGLIGAVLIGAALWSSWRAQVR